MRNLLYGIEDAKKYGSVCKTGYFPDAFGNVGQMTQILKQAGMEAVAFGRGVRPVGFNNQVEGNDYLSAFSELTWKSPDVVFLHSDFPTYIECVKKSLDSELSVVTGELTS